MSIEPFIVKCPECGKEIPTYRPNVKSFCSKMCESNYKYRRKFDGAQAHERPSFDDVRKLGISNVKDEN